MKKTKTLVKDIYAMMESKDADPNVDVEAEIEKFGESVKALMRTEFGSEKRQDKRTLRLSNIGRTDRYLWNVVAGTEKEKIDGATYVKFMYGHLVEEMLLFLTRLSGHTVTDEQKRCEVLGIQGSMDCKIDGVVTDVKSASPYGFKKFKEGKLLHDDPFGYVDQIKAYAHSEGETEIGWLAMDKVGGHLTYLKYDLAEPKIKNAMDFNGTIEERVIHLKEMVKKPEPNYLCHQPEPEGKSGNMRLAMGCSYCQYKKHCYPDLRLFTYSYAPKYLCKVVKEPNVREVKI